MRVFTDMPLTKFFLKQYYEKEGASSQNRIYSDYRHQNLFNLVNKLMRHNKYNSILDVGCAEGTNLFKIENVGNHVVDCHL